MVEALEVIGLLSNEREALDGNEGKINETICKITGALNDFRDNFMLQKYHVCFEEKPKLE